MKTVKKKEVKLTNIKPMAAEYSPMIVFNALDTAYIEAGYSLSGQQKKVLGRLRDMAAVAAGKPTLAELED